MGLFAKLAGITSTFFQVGGPAGPGLNANGAVLEARNSANSAYAVMRGGAPAGDNDLVTKKYVDTVANKPIPVAAQFNGNSALPSNTGVEQWLVVTTTGANATIGQLLWDDGTGVGTVAVIASATGNTIVTEAAFNGGTIALAATQMYVWNGSAWTNISPSVAGAVFCIDFAITNAASQSSATSVPANAVVLGTKVNIGTPYSAGATIKVGQTGTTNLLQDTGDNVPQTANLYEASQRVAWGASALAVLVTIAGAPAAGAGNVTVVYSVPNA